MLDTNVQVVVQPRKDKAYLLTPLSDANTLSVNPELIEKVKQAEHGIKAGEFVEIADPKKQVV